MTNGLLDQQKSLPQLQAFNICARKSANLANEPYPN